MRELVGHGEQPKQGHVDERGLEMQHSVQR
jgi:hypothetical protein